MDDTALLLEFARTASEPAFAALSIKIMAWTKIKTAVGFAALIGCVAGGGVGLYAHHSSQLKPAAELQAALDAVKKTPTGNLAISIRKSHERHRGFWFQPG